MSSEQGKKDETLDVGPFTSPQQIQLPVPVGRVNAVGIGGAACGSIDDRIDTIQGVIQAVGFEQIAPGQFTTPLLKERRFPGHAHHATDVMPGIESTAGDLSSEGARATQYQNQHQALSCKTGSLDRPCGPPGIQSPSSLSNRAPPARPTGISTQKMAAMPKISEAMVFAATRSTI